MNRACECCGNDDAGYQVCPDCLADPCDHGAEPREDVFLVAFCVARADNRDEAQDALITELKTRLLLGAHGGPNIQEWWIAENDRRDRSDNDSAEFVPFRPTPRGHA